MKGRINPLIVVLTALGRLPQLYAELQSQIQVVTKSHEPPSATKQPICIYIYIMYIYIYIHIYIYICGPISPLKEPFKGNLGVPPSNSGMASALSTAVCRLRANCSFFSSSTSRSASSTETAAPFRLPLQGSFKGDVDIGIGI